MSRSSREHPGQPIDLVDVGDGGQEYELLATCGLVAADEVLERPCADQIPCCDLLREPAGEGVVVPQVRRSALGVTQCEVTLPPELRLPGPAVSARAAWSDLGRSRQPQLWGQGYFALGDAERS